MLLFLLLEGLAVRYYAHSTAYTQARLLSRSNQVVGSVQGFFAGIRHYFTLGGENRRLLDRVVELETRLARYEAADEQAWQASCVDSLPKSPYRLMTARVVSNTVNRRRNLITLDKGLRDGVTILKRLGVFAT